MQTIVHVDPTSFNQVVAKLEVARRKMRNARTEKSLNEHGKSVELLEAQLQNMPKQLNPKMLEELLMEINLRVVHFQEAAAKLKAKFDEDPISFLEWHQTDLVRHLEKQRIYTRLYGYIQVASKLPTIEEQVLKAGEVFDLFHEQMTERVRRWARNPYGSSSPQSNITEAALVEANADLLDNMDLFNSYRRAINEAVKFHKEHFPGLGTPANASTECPAPQASA